MSLKSLTCAVIITVGSYFTYISDKPTNSPNHALSEQRSAKLRVERVVYDRQGSKAVSGGVYFDCNQTKQPKWVILENGQATCR